jgi:hypothetical protein
MRNSSTSPRFGRVFAASMGTYAGSRMNLDGYRAQAEEFVSAIDREYYLHFSGQKDDFEIEAIYERHTGLFVRDEVDRLRENGNALLLDFAVKGLIGRETKEETAELARREAALEIEVDGETMPFREAPVRQSNSPDPERRAAIEAARNAATAAELNPLLRLLHERSATLAVELGWPSYRAMCEELSEIDLGALGEQTDAFLEGSQPAYEPTLQPELERQLGFGFERLRRADVAAFLRAAALDADFPAERLVPSLVETLAGLGIDAEAQPGVVLDTERRPKKSPRAFCAPVRVPDEVYLVIAPQGGRDDFAALFHEAGHTEHYAHVDRALPVEQRYFGDNSITEGFAFLFEHLVAEPEWLRRRLGVSDPEQITQHARASKLFFLRRYCAKLRYELELHDEGTALDDMPARYSELLGRALRVEWPQATWLSDVDDFYYAARYLRAWALETHLRRQLEERFGEGWFDEPAAGEQLKALWRSGQSATAEELLGVRLDFSVLQADLGL